MLHHTILPARAGRNVRILLSNSTAIALVLALAMPVNAQVLEEIIVTAQKREQNIQDVGISVAAFTGDQMRTLGITNSFDITAWVPNVNVSGNLGGQNTQFSIRGVTQNDFNDVIESPVAVYLDEGYIPIAQANTFALFDIERVEIMKGPQSTLFGRNATGGVVQYISRQPSCWKPQPMWSTACMTVPTTRIASGSRQRSAARFPTPWLVASRSFIQTGSRTWKIFTGITMRVSRVRLNDSGPVPLWATTVFRPMPRPRMPAPTSAMPRRPHCAAFCSGTPRTRCGLD
jgi:outer membrane cobalamin receptor